MREKLMWVALLAAIAAVFYFSGDGFYRYPCQDPPELDRSVMPASGLHGEQDMP